VKDGTTLASAGQHIPLALSAAAEARGLDVLYRGPEQKYIDSRLQTYLQNAVYGGDRLRDIYEMPLWFGFVSLLAQLPFSIRKDIRRRKELKYGRRLKGPVLLTPKQFNKTVSGDGIGFVTTEAKEMMRIPLQAESQHIELMGDTGAGKTTLIMQVLRQIQSRGHAAIVYDPACEFIQRFYDEKRKDIVLNPLDERCPYWGPSEELRRKAEAKAIAASLYQPTSDKKGEFFTETPQKIFAHLLTYGPNPQQLVEWLSKPAEIDQRVQGTEMEAMIAKGAQQQRNGVLASLGLVADSLRMLPTKEQAKNKTWSATEWSVTVISTDPRANQLTVEREDGQHVTYDPKRLHGIAAYREIARDFAEGDRLQFTVSKPDMEIRNRDLGTVERIDGTNMTVRMDGDKARTLTFDTSEMRHFDHGYAVTSHSSQGLTTDRVLVNMDTKAHPELINTRFAYVSVSRASEDARVYTNDATTLADRLSTDISKASAVQVARPNSETQAHHPQSKEQPMTNTKELTPEEQRRQFQQEVHDPATNKAQSPSEIDQRHYTPIHTALPNEAAGYEWKRETGDIQSYQHNQTAGWLHIDPQGQFYDRHAHPITREHALEHAGHVTLAVNEISQAQSIAKGTIGNDQGLSL
jgi:GTPase SAR1 family protein